ncbi:hypothetical protein Tco_0496170 [Tanacetum coccineum]
MRRLQAIQKDSRPGISRLAMSSWKPKKKVNESRYLLLRGKKEDLCGKKPRNGEDDDDDDGTMTEEEEEEDIMLPLPVMVWCG